MEIFGFVKILKDSIKIISKNGVKMASITILSFLINFVFYIIFIFSTKPLMDDIYAKIMQLPNLNPASPEFFTLVFAYTRDVGFLLGVEILYYFVSIAVSLLLISLIVSISSSVYIKNSLSCKELFSNALTSYKRPLVTYLFVLLMSIGYMYLVLCISLVPLFVFLQNFVVVKSILYPFWILAFVLYTGLSVVWILGLVISVVDEDHYGLQALGKSARVIKGKRLDGFIITLGWNMIFLALFWVIMELSKPGSTSQIITGLGVVILVSLMQLFVYTMYTSLYFECKKNHGEEYGEYSKIPTTTDIP